MSLLTIIYACMFYAATALMVGGLAYKIAGYARTPAPLKIPTTPAPTTTSGVALRMAREVVLFESLFKANKWIWIFGWVFHGALLLVLLRHLRYFIEPVPGVIAAIQPFGLYAGFRHDRRTRRVVGAALPVERIKYISTPSDHLMLALLIAIGASGLMMKFVSHTDIVAVKAFILGVMLFDCSPCRPMCRCWCTCFWWRR